MIIIAGGSEFPPGTQSDMILAWIVNDRKESPAAVIVFVFLIMP